MSNRLCCSPARRLRASKMRRALLSFALVMMGCLAGVPPCAAGDAPAWMHALVSAPLPAHDEKTDGVLLYSERIITVQSADKFKITVREAYKILRPGGREYGAVTARAQNLVGFANSNFEFVRGLYRYNSLGIEQHPVCLLVVRRQGRTNERVHPGGSVSRRTRRHTCKTAHHN